ncbi:MAG: cyclic nucleotide-binding domain-containing protein [Magnetococcales bacterium]|nr:cyclic nucleotide-binding domain-containing protein [Magnetococcales bacterium]
MALSHLLQKTHLFAGIDLASLAPLESFTQRLVFEPGYNESLLVISAQESSGPDLYLVLDGTITLDQQTEGNGLAPNQAIASLEEELFGEISWLLQRPRLSDLYTHSRAVLLRIDGQKFNQWLADHPEVAATVWQRIARTLANRLTCTFQENQTHKQMAKLFNF